MVTGLVDPARDGLAVAVSRGADGLEAPLRGDDRGSARVAAGAEDLIGEADVRRGDLLLEEIVEIEVGRLDKLPQRPFVLPALGDKLLEARAVPDPLKIAQASAAIHDLPADGGADVGLAAAGLPGDEKARPSRMGEVFLRLLLHCPLPGLFGLEARKGAALHKARKPRIPQALLVSGSVPADTLPRATGPAALFLLLPPLVDIKSRLAVPAGAAFAEAVLQKQAPVS